MRPEDLLSNPWVPGFLGALLGQRALGTASWLVRLGYLLSCWACAILFGPWAAGKLGAAADPVANAAVIGAVGAFGLVIFDGLIRWAQSTSFPELVQQLLSVFRSGGKGGGNDRG